MRLSGFVAPQALRTERPSVCPTCRITVGVLPAGTYSFCPECRRSGDTLEVSDWRPLLTALIWLPVIAGLIVMAIVAAVGIAAWVLGQHFYQWVYGRA